MKKKYSNGDITIVWEPDKCIHSTKCFGSLPRVFNPKKRPWVDMAQGSTEDIILTVKNCPSQALSLLKEEKQQIDNSEVSTTEITVLPNGPVLIKGAILLNYNGTKEPLEQDQIALCRCGASNKKPYCDGSHAKIDFKAP